MIRDGWLPSHPAGGNLGGLPVMSMRGTARASPQFSSIYTSNGRTQWNRTEARSLRNAECNDAYDSWGGNNPDVHGVLVGDTECASIVWHSEHAISCTLTPGPPADASKTVVVHLRDGRSNAGEAATLGRMWFARQSRGMAVAISED